MSRTENEAGYRDGYRVGPDGIDPDGNRAAGYDLEFFGRPDYQAGLSEGRTDRIDEQLVSGTFNFQWPGMQAGT